MAGRKALGKGLGAFFPEFDDSEEKKDQGSQKGGEQAKNQPGTASADPKQRINVVLQVPVANIRPNPQQPRKNFDPERLHELSDSIANHGLIQPITVRYIGEKKFELISGERRLRASKLAGLQEIPAYIRKADDDELIAFALVENIQREELNPIEVAMGYQRLIDECDYTQAEVAEKVGKNRTTVTNTLRLLNLPPYIQAALRDENIKMGHARALITIESASVQKKLLNRTIEEEYSVRELENAIRRYRNKKNKKKTKSNTTELDAFYRNITSKLRSKLSTKVAIKTKKKGGEIRIEYYSDEELERIYQLFESIS